LIAATYDRRPGREWRPLQDTADAAPFLYDALGEWTNWRRGTDFYEEGELLWLDVDTTMRRFSNDQKSMNDFCHLFHGGPGGEPSLKTYTFEDVVATLNGLVPYDWASFLRTRLDSVSPNTPIEAVENGGWKLVYNEEPNEFEANAEGVAQRADLRFSSGLIIGDNGTVYDVLHGSPAYAAGIGPGMKFAAVNGQQYSAESLRNAITEAKSSKEPIRLIIANGPQYQTISLDYHGGLHFPHIVRDESRPDYLSEIFHPLAP
jgi:predicted metalloprotease with PDZ domain